MSSGENAYVNLAQRASKIGPFHETLLGVLWIVGIWNTRVNIDSILNQTPSQVVQTWLQKNEQVHWLLWNVGKNESPANDATAFAKAA